MSYSSLMAVYTHMPFIHTFSIQFGDCHWWPAWVAPFFVLVLPVTQLHEEPIQETKLVKKNLNQKTINWSVFHCFSSLNCHCMAACQGTKVIPRELSLKCCGTTFSKQICLHSLLSKTQKCQKQFFPFCFYFPNVYSSLAISELFNLILLVCSWLTQRQVSWDSRII